MSFLLLQKFKFMEIKPGVILMSGGLDSTTLAYLFVKEKVDFITQRSGGTGAVRELIDFLFELKAC